MLFFLKDNKKEFILWLNVPKVTAYYGGDMKEVKANELLDDIDFYYNKVKCRKIEQMLPTLNKLVVAEQQSWMGSM
jgi:hypothetical protein